MDDVNDDSYNDYDEDVIWSGAWLGALLRSRFDFLGLGGHCHAVLQIGGSFGLLIAVLSDVKPEDFKGHLARRAQQV